MVTDYRVPVFMAKTDVEMKSRQVDPKQQSRDKIAKQMEKKEKS